MALYEFRIIIIIIIISLLRLRNDLYWVGWGVKLYSLTVSLQDNSPTNLLAVSQVADWITRGVTVQINSATRDNNNNDSHDDIYSAVVYGASHMREFTVVPLGQSRSSPGGHQLVGQVAGQLADKPIRGQSSRGLGNSRTCQLTLVFDLKFGVYNSSKCYFGQITLFIHCQYSIGLELGLGLIYK